MNCQASGKVRIIRDKSLVCNISSSPVEVSTALELGRAVVEPCKPGNREWNEPYIATDWGDLHLSVVIELRGTLVLAVYAVFHPMF